MTRSRAEVGGAPRAAVFLDRDGTVIVDRHHLGDPAGVELLPGAAAAIRTLNQAHLPIVLVTNQSGIGRGLFSTADFQAVQRRLVELLEAQHARVDAVYHCPHSPEHDPPCHCRKPLPGLYQRAAEELGLDLSRSFYVGDRPRDVAAATLFGGTGFLLESESAAGPGSASPSGELPQSAAVYVVSSLEDAAAAILRQHTVD